MQQLRVVDLAHTMGITSKELIFKLRSIGVSVTSDEDTLDLSTVRSIITGETLQRRPREVIVRSEARQEEATTSTARDRMAKRRRRQVVETEKEILEFAPESFDDEAEAVGDVVLLGSEATEAGFRFSVSRRPRWQAVHVACHGVVDPDRPTLSALALTPTAADDGFLTALDVFRLRVPADLVVLSACDSGVGKIVNAEGVLGLMRAFVFAGAPRVVVSLGRVSDTATRAFMEAFYAQFQAGAPAATALRGAQTYVRGHPEWAHPHFWASWVLWGLPR